MLTVDYDRLGVAPGDRLLDLGAGGGRHAFEASRRGARVIALDADAAELKDVGAIFAAMDAHDVGAVNGDALRLPFPDASFDRIVCLNAFHHVPNPADVLNEMARVLRPGGIAGFSEPGAGHSRSAQSQYEMRNYTVIENDIVIEDIERWALDAGFCRLEIAVVDPRSYRLSWQEYTDLIAGGVAAERYVDVVREAAAVRRLFFLYKAGEITPDSRQRRGLMGVARVRLDEMRVASGGEFHGEAFVQNTGSNVWLASDARFGPVFLGVHLFKRDGQLIDLDYGRIHLPRSLKPGESATFRFTLPAPIAAGEYRFGFDFVSERVSWFATNGAEVALVDVQVA
jgi:SAM-dependent methyltransferase